MSEPQPPPEPLRPPPLPSRVIPTADFPIFEGVSVALTSDTVGDKIHIGVTRAGDQVDDEGNPLDPAKDTKVILSGANPSLPPDDGDVAILDDAVGKVLGKREEMTRKSYPPELVERVLQSEIHTITAGAGLRKLNVRTQAEVPGKLKDIADQGRSDIQKIAEDGLRRAEELRRRQGR